MRYLCTLLICAYIFLNKGFSKNSFKNTFSVLKSLDIGHDGGIAGPDLGPNSFVPGRVAQSVTGLATDACLTADPGVASSIPARSHTFVEIDHEIISTVILLPSADSFKKGCCQLQAKVCAQITG